MKNKLAQRNERIILLRWTASPFNRQVRGGAKVMGDMSEESKRFEESKSFVSSLGAGREAFHSEITEFCLRIGERSPEDFIRHFSSEHIMRALTSRPTERARIISAATGVNERVAHKMSPEASGEALQIALDEKVATPADIVQLFQPDDRQRYLDRRALWTFNIEGEPWKVTASNRTGFERAKSYIAYILDRALVNLLLTHTELLNAITVEKLAALLPREELGAIIATSLRLQEKFSEEHLLASVPPRTLIDHVPLDYFWTRVIGPLIAERHDYATRAGGGFAKPESPLSDDSSWSLNPARDPDEEEVVVSDPSFPPGDGDIVTADDIIEEEATVAGDVTTTRSGKDRKSARHA